MCRKEARGDRWEASHGNTIASVIHENSFEALIQYATVAGHFPGVNASSVKPKPKKVNKVEVTTEEPMKGDTQVDTQVNATHPTTPRPKPKSQPKASPQATPAKVESKPPEGKREGKGGGKGKRGKPEPRVEKRKQQCIYFYRGTCQRGDQCRYVHQVGDDGKPVPVGDLRSCKDLMML